MINTIQTGYFSSPKKKRINSSIEMCSSKGFSGGVMLFSA